MENCFVMMKYPSIALWPVLRWILKIRDFFWSPLLAENINSAQRLLHEKTTVEKILLDKKPAQNLLQFYERF